MVKSNTKKSVKEGKQKILVGFGIFVAVYVISMFVPVISSYTRFPVYIVKCDGLPVITSDLAGKSYSLPGDEMYGPSIFKNSYFCTEQEVIEKGYRSYNKN